MRIFLNRMKSHPHTPLRWSLSLAKKMKQMRQCKLPRLNRTNSRLPIEDENEIVEYYTKEQKLRISQRNLSRQQWWQECWRLRKYAMYWADLMSFWRWICNSTKLFFTWSGRTEAEPFWRRDFRRCIQWRPENAPREEIATERQSIIASACGRTSATMLSLITTMETRAWKIWGTCLIRSTMNRGQRSRGSHLSSILS